MKVLIYLYFLRMKANIRNVFSKPATAIFAILMILLYGGAFIGMLFGKGGTLASASQIDINSSIFVGIGFTALLVGIMLMQKNKSLFMENDAFYIFTGPFKRSHAMNFIMSQSLVGALFSGLSSLFIMIFFGSGVHYSIIFLVMVTLGHALVYLFFTVLYYYLYLLSIVDQKYKKAAYIIIAAFVAITVAVYVYVFIQKGSLEQTGIAFLNSEAFYFVPLFGWLKMILVSYLAGDMMLMLIGILLLIGACGIVYASMIRFKGEFIEQAMEDAINFSKRYKEVKAGNRTSMNDKKVRNVKGTFKEGAAAIYSKNMLLMKKGNSFITWMDLSFIGIYLVISLAMDMGYMFFIYMMVFWLFSSIQNAEFMKEMDYYHIYLIPEPPMKKLTYLLFPYFIKYVLLSIVPVVVGGMLLGASVGEMANNYLLLAGYACLFIAASVLAMRLLKSRNSNFMENLLRMLIIGIASIPSIVMMMIVSNLNMITLNTLHLISYTSLLINFILSLLILYACKSMMNGREIKSE